MVDVQASSHVLTKYDEEHNRPRQSFSYLRITSNHIREREKGDNKYITALTIFDTNALKTCLHHVEVQQIVWLGLASVFQTEKCNTIVLS